MKARETALHYPRLDTVLMIEDAIKNAKTCQSRTSLWQGLPRKVMYQTYKIAIDYLIQSRKVIITKDGSLMWVFADSAKARKLIAESVAAHA